MTPPALKHLSGLDATFLYLETPETPMHVGSLHLYELPEGFKGSFHAAVIQHMAKRIHLSSIFTSKLAFMPFDLGHPIWVHDEHFDLARHVRKISAAKMTVTMAQDMAAKLHGSLIDRKHPLWKFYVFDRIVRKDGSVCAGFYSKIHHAALDGKGGTALANAVLDVTPVPREVAPPDPARKTRSAGDLKIGEMIGAVFSNSLAQYAKLAKSLPSAASQIGSTLGKNNLKLSGKSIKAKSPISLAPKTPFNVGISAERVFVTASLPFAECKLMAKSIGASFNDIVLWICSTALRSYLAQHASIPKKPLVAAMPVSLRDDSNKDMGNQASMSLANLGTHIAHPVKRMAAIMESTGKVKQALVNLKSVLPTDYPSFLAPWIVGGAARLALKTYGRGSVAEKLPMVANLVISNVPGPQVPLYMAGARMLTFHPLSIVMHGLGLNITIQTYAGNVDFGIIAGKNALPHAQDLANALLAAFKEAQGLYALGQAQGTVQAAVVTPTPAKTPVPHATKKQTVASNTIAAKTIAVKAGTLKAKSTPARRKTATARSGKPLSVKKSNATIHGTTKAIQRTA
jgi:diacylglycerol O-acyltransferase / wax synthase